MKLICCRIAVVCLEILHSKTATELQGVFTPIFDKFKEEKFAGSRNGGSVSAGSTRRTSTFVKPAMMPRNKTSASMATASNVDKNKIYLSIFEAQRFRDRTLTALETSVARNMEMIWTVRELFHEETFKILLHQVYFNSPELRAEALNLIFRVHSFRAELAKYLLKELQESRVEDSKTIAYVSRQRSALQQVLTGFHFIDKPTAMSSFSASAEGGNSAAGSSTATGDEPLDDADAIFQLNLFKLKKVLLNADLRYNHLGIVQYCFHSSELSMAVSAKRSLPAASRSPGRRAAAAGAGAASAAGSDFPTGLGRSKPSSLRHCSREELLSRRPDELNQRMLVDMDLHKIVLEFLSKNASWFKYCVDNRHRKPPSMQSYSRSVMQASSVVRAFGLKVAAGRANATGTTTNTTTNHAAAENSDSAADTLTGNLFTTADHVAAAENVARSAAVRMGFGSNAPTGRGVTAPHVRAKAPSSRARGTAASNVSVGMEGKRDGGRGRGVGKRVGSVDSALELDLSGDDESSSSDGVDFHGSGGDDDDEEDDDDDNDDNDHDGNYNFDGGMIKQRGWDRRGVHFGNGSNDAEYGGGRKQARSSPFVLAKNRKYLGTSLRFENYLQVFELCFLFLRAVIRNNPQVAAVLSTRQVIGLALELRQYCSEAVRFFVDLVHENKDAVAVMEVRKKNIFYHAIREYFKTQYCCVSKGANKANGDFLSQ